MAAHLIALTGRASSGKSTAAKALQDVWGFQRVKFADPLKNMLRSLLRTGGMGRWEIEECLEGRLKEVPCDLLMGQTPRQAMITLGTEWGRNQIHQDLWLRLARGRITTLLHAGVDVVVDDCRFVNEAATIHSLGGRIVQIERDTGQVEFSNHLSEQGCGPADEVIDNNGDLTDLMFKLEEIL